MSWNLDKYLPTWRKRLAEDADALERRRREAEEAAARMAAILGTEFRAERVFLVGSLLEPEWFGPSSDIDLVVVGLEPALYFKALSRIWKELPRGMEVDLIPYEDAYERLRTLALTEGRILYEND